MRYIEAMERRLQDLERAFQNMERRGKVVDTKYDSEKKRWMVKMNDGPDQNPSGQDNQSSSGSSGSEDSERTFKTDWLPWKSFAHGSISMSIPPRKGMNVLMRSPCGSGEIAVCEPFHNNEEGSSPHDKEDEVVIQVKMPKQQNQDGQSGQSSGSGQSQQQEDDPQQTLRIKLTKDAKTITLGDTTWTLSKDTVHVKTKNHIFEVDDNNKITLNSQGITLKGTTIKENE